MKFKFTPTHQIALILVLYSIGAILANPNPLVFLHLLATLGSAIILFGLLTIISGKKKNIWNTIISALIIFLILHYGLDNGDLVYAVIATFITVISKFFLEIKNLPVINPVVFGLLLTFLIGWATPGLDQPFISWWGASYQTVIAGRVIPIALILSLLWIFLGLKNWHKYPILITFLITHALAIIIRTNIDMLDGAVFDWAFLKFTFSDATIYFFAAIMLIEPKSSPLLKKQQIIFGIVAAIAYNLLGHFNVVHFDLISIAIANLYFFGTKSLRSNTNAA